MREEDENILSNSENIRENLGENIRENIRENLGENKSFIRNRKINQTNYSINNLNNVEIVNKYQK